MKIEDEFLQKTLEKGKELNSNKERKRYKKMNQTTISKHHTI